MSGRDEWVIVVACWIAVFAVIVLGVIEAIFLAPPA